MHLQVFHDLKMTTAMEVRKIKNLRNLLSYF